VYADALVHCHPVADALINVSLSGRLVSGTGLGISRHAGLTSEWFEVNCGPTPDSALTIWVSTHGQTWTELEGPHLSVQRSDDGDVKVDQVGLP
jgi:hypothetical protein